jgi:hypothetical protein
VKRKLTSAEIVLLCIALPILLVGIMVVSVLLAVSI